MQEINGRNDLNHWTAGFTILMCFPARIHTVHKRSTRPASENEKGTTGFKFSFFRMFQMSMFDCVDFRMFRILTGKGNRDRMPCASYNSNGSQSVSSMAFDTQYIVYHYKLVDPLFYFTNTKSRKVETSSRKNSFLSTEPFVYCTENCSKSFIGLWFSWFWSAFFCWI